MLEALWLISLFAVLLATRVNGIIESQWDHWESASFPHRMLPVLFNTYRANALCEEDYRSHGKRRREFKSELALRKKHFKRKSLMSVLNVTTDTFQVLWGCYKCVYTDVLTQAKWESHAVPRRVLEVRRQTDFTSHSCCGKLASEFW